MTERTFNFENGSLITTGISEGGSVFVTNGFSFEGGSHLEVREQNLDSNGEIRNSAHLKGSDDGGSTLRTLRTGSDGTLVVRVEKDGFQVFDEGTEVASEAQFLNFKGEIASATLNGTGVNVSFPDFGSVTSVGSANQVGSAFEVSRADHVHKGVSSIGVIGSPKIYGDVVLEVGSWVYLNQTGSKIKISLGEVKTQYTVADSNADLGNFRVLSIATNGDGRITFGAPIDFSHLASLYLVAIPPAGAAEPDVDIDLYSHYGAVGELYNTHSESDTTTLYDFTNQANKITKIDITHLFSNLSGGDICGLCIDHQGTPGTIHYLGICMVYI